MKNIQKINHNDLALDWSTVRVEIPVFKMTKVELMHRFKLSDYY